MRFEHRVIGSVNMAELTSAGFQHKGSITSKSIQVRQSGPNSLLFGVPPQLIYTCRTTAKHT